MPVPQRWAHDRFVVREKRLTLGRQYYIEAAGGALVGYCKQKMFRLKEDIRIYADTDARQEVLVLRATKILDFNANFEVVDPTTGEHLGFLRRKGWSSLLRDEWQIADAHGGHVATLKEDSMMMAMLRRIVTNIIPSHYHIEIGPGAEKAATIDERFQIWGDTFDVAIMDRRLDPRVVVGLAVLMDAVEKEREK